MQDIEQSNFPYLKFLRAYRLNLSIAPPHQEQNCSTLERDAEIFLLVSTQMVPQGRSERRAKSQAARQPLRMLNLLPPITSFRRETQSHTTTTNP